MKKKCIYLFFVVYNIQEDIMDIVATKVTAGAAAAAAAQSGEKEIMTKKQLGLFQRDMNQALGNKRTDEMQQTEDQLRLLEALFRTVVARGLLPYVRASAP